MQLKYTLCQIDIDCISSVYHYGTFLWLRNVHHEMPKSDIKTSGCDLFITGLE